MSWLCLLLSRADSIDYQKATAQVILYIFLLYMCAYNTYIHTYTICVNIDIYNVLALPAAVASRLYRPSKVAAQVILYIFLLNMYAYNVCTYIYINI